MVGGRISSRAVIDADSLVGIIGRETDIDTRRDGGGGGKVTESGKADAIDRVVRSLWTDDEVENSNGNGGNEGEREEGGEGPAAATAMSVSAFALASVVSKFILIFRGRNSVNLILGDLNDIGGGGGAAR